MDLTRLPRTVRLGRDQGRLAFEFIDQTLLPDVLAYRRTASWREVVEAVKALAVRGAPAIGIAGAAALALWADSDEARALPEGSYRQRIAETAEEIATARPTAVNLRWAVDRALARADEAYTDSGDARAAASALERHVLELVSEDEMTNRAIGAYGAELLYEGSRVLTHCNAGSLATAFYGTALGIVYSAAEQGKIERVYADETRPLGQGRRLTVWELAQAGIPVTLICDDMAASLMAAGEVDAVIVGADRIAANGDTANKIGTYGVAISAREHDIPFYVAAPTSTIDLSIASGAQIPIELRASEEVLERPIAGVDVWNPAFDVTPARFITKIITEKGVFLPEQLARGL